MRCEHICKFYMKDTIIARFDLIDIEVNCWKYAHSGTTQQCQLELLKGAQVRSPDCSGDDETGVSRVVSLDDFRTK